MRSRPYLRPEIHRDDATLNAREKPPSSRQEAAGVENPLPLFLRRGRDTPESAGSSSHGDSLPDRIRLAASQGGEPLAPYLQHTFERRLGADLSRVRIHRGAEADQLARDVHARAFTTGPDIFFRGGEYQPESPAGLETLAHEVVHTVQQRNRPVAAQASPEGVSVSEPFDTFEQEADTLARTLVAGDSGPPSVAPSLAPPGLQRKCACEESGTPCAKCEEEEKDTLQIHRRADTSPSGPAEMIPGYQARYSSVPAGAGGGLVIQRAKIDHRAITWADFQGKAPKGATFDALTSSDFTDPGLDSVIPTKLKAVDTGDKCTLAGKPATKFKVDIAIDPAAIKLKSFMSQENSWHKDWVTNADARKARCLEFSAECEASFDQELKKAHTQRASQETACRKFFADIGAKVDTLCQKRVADCKDAFAKGSTSFDSATSAAECDTKVLKDCKDAAMKGPKFTDPSSKATATSAAECAKPFGEDFEKYLKSQEYWTKTLAGASAKVTNRDDCRKPAFLDPCVKDLMAADAARLLAHEQRHFDMTDALAAKAQSDLRALVGTFPKEVVACGQKEAEDLGKKTLSKELDQLKDKLKDAKKQLGSLQSQYDTETHHGTVDEKQAEWAKRISKGFMKP